MEKDLFTGEDNEYIPMGEDGKFLILNNVPEGWEDVAQAHLRFFHENHFNE